jgi:hypothetical protein
MLVLNFCWLVFVSEMESVLLEIGSSHQHIVYIDRIHAHIFTCALVSSTRGHRVITVEKSLL